MSGQNRNFLHRRRPSQSGAPRKNVFRSLAVADLFNDGWLDLFVANGHVYPQVDTIPRAPKYREPIELFRNLGDGTFEDISAAAGLAQVPLACRRGAAFGDVNNDGNMDMVILNVGEPPTLLINRAKTLTTEYCSNLWAPKATAPPSARE